MKLLVISLEFASGTFSGNGIYCMSQVRALLALGHDVLVVSGCPSPPEDHASQASDLESSAIKVPLPTWGRLDRGSSWEAFATGMRNDALLNMVAAFRPQAILGIDWSALPAYRALIEGLAHIAPDTASVPYVYMNYRVYARNGDDADDYAFHLHWERESMLQAILTTALSRSDAQFLTAHVAPASYAADIKVLLPALRSDMERVSPMLDETLTSNDTASSLPANDIRGKYLLCCVRLSPEKEPNRFIELVKALERRGVLRDTGILPMLIGPATTPYACEIKQRLRAACGLQVRIEEQFLGPQDLAKVYQRTLLNVHPCVYDAYGMTIIEAASQGVPSLVQQGGSVGATDLLSGEEGQVILVDFAGDVELVADRVEHLLCNPSTLRRVCTLVGQAAYNKARSWTERHNAAALIDVLQGLIT